MGSIALMVLYIIKEIITGVQSGHITLDPFTIKVLFTLCGVELMIEVGLIIYTKIKTRVRW